MGVPSASKSPSALSAQALRARARAGLIKLLHLDTTSPPFLPHPVSILETNPLALQLRGHRQGEGQRGQVACWTQGSHYQPLRWNCQVRILRIGYSSKNKHPKKHPIIKHPLKIPNKNSNNEHPVKNLFQGQARSCWWTRWRQARSCQGKTKSYHFYWFLLLVIIIISTFLVSFIGIQNLYLARVSSRPRSRLPADLLELRQASPRDSLGLSWVLPGGNRDGNTIGICCFVFWSNTLECALTQKL